MRSTRRDQRKIGDAGKENEQKKEGSWKQLGKKKKKLSKKIQKLESKQKKMKMKQVIQLTLIMNCRNPWDKKT